MDETYDSRVAAAIVSYNHKDTVVRLLTRLHDLGIQTSITENASSDGTIESIRGRFSNTTILESSSNLGGTGGFNCALLSALSLNSKYIILLDDDVFPDNDCIDILADFLDTHDEYVFAAPSIYIESTPGTLQETGGGVNFSKRLTVEAWNRFSVNPTLPEILDINYASACCLMVRTAAIRRIGVMDWNYFIFSDDVDWSLRLTRRCGKAACVTRAKATHDFPWAKPFSPLRLYYFQRNGLYMISKLRNGPNNHISLFFALFRMLRDLIQSGLTGDHEIFYTLKSALYDSFTRRYGKWNTPNTFGVLRKIILPKMIIGKRIQSVLVDITIEDHDKNIVQTLEKLFNDNTLSIDVICDDTRQTIYREKGIFSKIFGRKPGLLNMAKLFLKIKKENYDLVITDAFMSPRRPTSHLGKSAWYYHDKFFYSAESRPILSLFLTFIAPVLAMGLSLMTAWRFLARPQEGRPPAEAAPLLLQLGIDPEVGQPWSK